MLRLLLLLLMMFAMGIVWRVLRITFPPPARGGGPAHMVRCANCDLYVPEHEALRADGRCYCSEAHRAAGPREARGP